MSLADHFRDMARNNAWSNQRLMGACRKLSEAEIWAERTSFFPSIGETLNHVLVVDWYYLDALMKGGRGRAVYERSMTPYRAIEDLAEAQFASDRMLIAYCAKLADRDLDGEVLFDRGRRGMLNDTVGATLPHLFVHQIHHRGQVHAMLSGTRHEPPQLDEYFLKEDRVIADAELKAGRF